MKQTVAYLVIPRSQTLHYCNPNSKRGFTGFVRSNVNRPMLFRVRAHPLMCAVRATSLVWSAMRLKTHPCACRVGIRTNRFITTFSQITYCSQLMSGSVSNTVTHITKSTILPTHCRKFMFARNAMLLAKNASTHLTSLIVHNVTNLMLVINFFRRSGLLSIKTMDFVKMRAITATKLI